MAKYKITFSETREVEKIPENCAECPFWELGRCYLPLSRARESEVKMRKTYLTKRHKDCSLTCEEV